MSLKRNEEYQKEAGDLLVGQQMFIMSPRPSAEWPKYIYRNEVRPWPASALKLSTHFQKLNVGKEETQFIEQCSRLDTHKVDIPQYDLHCQLCQMNCDMVRSAQTLKNGCDGKTFHSTLKCSNRYLSLQSTMNKKCGLL